MNQDNNNLNQNNLNMQDNSFAPNSQTTNLSGFNQNKNMSQQSISSQLNNEVNQKINPVNIEQPVPQTMMQQSVEKINIQNEFNAEAGNNNVQTTNFQKSVSQETLSTTGNNTYQKKTPKLIIPIILVAIIIIGVIVLMVYQSQNKTNGGLKEESNNLKYQFVFEFDDMTETTTTYTIIVKEKEIDIKYKNDIKHPELADGPLPEKIGGYTITEEKFIDPLKSIFEKIKAESDNGIVINDDFYLLLSSLDASQKASDNLCKVKGSWYCDIYADIMDYNNDGKVTVEENFEYYVKEIGIEANIVEDNRDNSKTKPVYDLEKKGLISEKQSTSSSKKYKTNKVANEIVLNGNTYKLGIDKFGKLLDNSFIMDSQVSDEITNSLKVYGHFAEYPEAKVYVTFHTSDYRTSTSIKDCIINAIEVYLEPNTAKLYYWKFNNFKIDENTTKTEVNNYFELATNGSKTVYLYTDKFLVKINCGSIYETHEYSNIFSIEIIEYNDNMTIPTWIK